MWLSSKATAVVVAFVCVLVKMVICAGGNIIKGACVNKYVFADKSIGFSSMMNNQFIINIIVDKESYFK